MSLLSNLGHSLLWCHVDTLMNQPIEPNMNMDWLGTAKVFVSVCARRACVNPNFPASLETKRPFVSIPYRPLTLKKTLCVHTRLCEFTHACLL